LVAFVAAGHKVRVMMEVKSQTSLVGGNVGLSNKTEPIFRSVYQMVRH